jgi:Domain of unknown function (DUF4157)
MLAPPIRKPEPAAAPVRGVLQRKCACGGSCPSCADKKNCLQPKLAVGPANDPLELEADRVAEQVLAQGSRSDFSSVPVSVQRRVPGEAQPSRDAPASVERVLAGSGRPLDAPLRQDMETRFGHDFSQVRLHQGGAAAQSAREVDALAYTVGNDIVFGAGQFAPHGGQGRQLLAHELAHVVQQGGGARLQRQPAPEGSGDGLKAAATPAAGSVATPAAAGEMKVFMTEFVTGVQGTIEFVPDVKACPKCKSIRLVQIVRVAEPDGTTHVFAGTESQRNKVKTKEDKKAGVKEGFFIDHYSAKCTKGNGCSVFYRDHAPNTTRSQDGACDGVTATKASLWDRPSGPALYGFQFETCAKCADTGIDLTCVDWGFSSDKDGKVTLAKPVQHTAPSATYASATAIFNKFYGNK